MGKNEELTAMMVRPWYVFDLHELFFYLCMGIIFAAFWSNQVIV